MKYKLFPAPFFNHFIQPSPPPIAKLESLHGVFLRGQFPPIKMVPSLCSLPSPHIITSKSPPNIYALPSPINMGTMIRQHAKFPHTARFPRQT